MRTVPYFLRTQMLPVRVRVSLANCSPPFLDQRYRIVPTLSIGMWTTPAIIWHARSSRQSMSMALAPSLTASRPSPWRFPSLALRPSLALALWVSVPCSGSGCSAVVGRRLPRPRSTPTVVAASLLPTFPPLSTTDKLDGLTHSDRQRIKNHFVFSDRDQGT